MSPQTPVGFGFMLHHTSSYLYFLLIIIIEIIHSSLIHVEHRVVYKHKIFLML